MRHTSPRVEAMIRRFDDRVSALLTSSRFGPWIGRGLTTLRYTGRRSGRVFVIPVGYRRKGDRVTIIADLPDTKNWWRNFTGDGGPVSLLLDGDFRTGHAVAHRRWVGWAEVTVTLAPPPAP